MLLAELFEKRKVVVDKTPADYARELNIPLNVFMDKVAAASYRPPLPLKPSTEFVEFTDI
jgi:hypothetical protein